MGLVLFFRGAGMDSERVEDLLGGLYNIFRN